MGRCVPLAVLCSLVLASAAGAHEAAYPGRNGLIAFVRGGQIWTVHTDGSGAVRLTHGSRSAAHPAWSPDGTKLAYDVGGSHVVVANADGSDPVDVSVESLKSAPGFGLGPCDSDPTWSPDGTEVAFTSVVDDCTGAAGGLYSTTPTGDGRRTIEQDYEGLLGGDTQPAWGRGGEIAFTRSDSLRMASGPYTHDVLLADGRTGKVLRRLTKSGEATSPAWSPDGTTLAFVERGTIVVATASGRRLRTLGKGAAPAWSPDGKRLVFADTAGLELVAASGGARRLLLRCSCSSPDWQPVP